MIFNIFLVISIIVLLWVEKISKKERDIPKWECFIMFFLFFLFQYITMKAMGILESGYHFVDDHEFLRFHNYLKDYGLWNALNMAVKGDMGIRFRFTYIIMRVFESYLWPNFILLHFIQTILVALGLYLSYIVARLHKCPIWLAYVFSLLIYIGPQAEVWWRLGPQENWGVIFFMLTIIAMFRYIRNSSRKNLLCLMIVSFFLGGTKEAFLILLPVISIMLIMEVMKAEESEVTFRAIIQTIRKHIVAFGWLWLICIVDIIVIIFYVGTNKIGYAGIDSSFGLYNYVYGIINICKHSLGVYMLSTVILGGGTLIVLVKTTKGVDRSKSIIYYGIEVFIVILMLSTQLILHAKSGIFSRYFIPSTIGFGIFWVIYAYRHLEKNRRVKVVYSIFVIIIFTSISMTSKVWKKGVEYAESGRNAEAVMQEVAEYRERNPVVISAMDSELDMSATLYLQEMYGIKRGYTTFYYNDNEYVTDIHRISDDELEKIHFTMGDMYITKENEEIIQGLMSEHSMDIDEFVRKDHGQYVLYIRKAFIKEP